eukprot:g1786.t1
MRLVYAKDYTGARCGIYDEDMKVDHTNQKYAAFPRLNQDLLEWATMQDLGPVLDLDVTDLSWDIVSTLNITSVCVEACPRQSQVVCTDHYMAIEALAVPPPSEEVDKCTNDIIFRTTHPDLCSNCWTTTIDTTALFYRCLEIIYTNVTETQTCIYPEEDPPLSADDNRCITRKVILTKESNRPTYDNPLARYMGDGIRRVTGWVSDMRVTFTVFMGVGIGGALVLAFLWIVFLRYFASCMVWTTIITYFLIHGFLAVYCWERSGAFSEMRSSFESMLSGEESGYNKTNQVYQNFTVEEDPEDVFLRQRLIEPEKVYKGLGVILSVSFLVLSVIVLAMTNKIRVAVEVVKEASRAVIKMPFVVIYPLWSISLQCYLCLFFILAGSYIASMTTVTTRDVFDSAMQKLDCDNVTNVGISALGTQRALRNDILCMETTVQDTTGVCCDADDAAAVQADPTLKFVPSLFTKAECEAAVKTPAVIQNGVVVTKETYHKWSDAPGHWSWTNWVNSGGCEGMNGCEWTGGAGGSGPCTGTPVQCTDAKLQGVSKKRQCEQQRGCIYNASGANGQTCTGTLPDAGSGGACADHVPMTTTIAANEARAEACTHLGVGLDEPKTLNEAMLWFHLFMFLWNLNFIEALSFTVLAGAVCQWYWIRPLTRHGEKKMPGKSPLFDSLLRVHRFHLGSIAYGSFIVALVQLVRIILAYIDSKTKEMQEESRFLKVMMKVVHCLLWCFEKSIKFITKNAYILIAMRGSSFCSSARHAFRLVLKNLAQFAVTNVISEIFLQLGKLMVMFGSCAGAYVWLWKTGDFEDSNGSKTFSSPTVPLVLTAFLAYCTGALVLAIYSSTIEVILLCFCEDYREFIEKDGGKKSHLAYMGPGLRKLVLGDGSTVLTQGEIDEMQDLGLSIEEALALHEANRKGMTAQWHFQYAKTGRGDWKSPNKKPTQQDIYEEEDMKKKMESKIQYRMKRSMKNLKGFMQKKTSF